MKRRNFLLGACSAALANTNTITFASDSPFTDPNRSARPRLQMPPLMDTIKTGRLDLTAQSGSTTFLDGAVSETIGFDQDYLGPVIRIGEGPLAANVQNDLDVPVTAHWHGLLVPGAHDGGPHSEIAPSDSWMLDMDIDQPTATAFYHTHAHGRTASDVYAGLAGVIHVTDGRDDERGLPSAYRVDDLTLVLQDRRFDAAGSMIYNLSTMDVMHGFAGEVMVVNGQIDAVAAVPKGIARLRLVNASNARILNLFMDDGRPMHLIGTDGGLLDTPTVLETLRLAPAERAEVLVDFSNGNPVTLMSDADPNQGPAGMMGQMRGLIDRVIDRSFAVLAIAVDETLPVRIERFPVVLDGELPDLDGANAPTRSISLDMGMGGGMGNGRMGRPGMGSGMMGGMMGQFGINGRAFDMERIDFDVKLGAVERWIVESPMLAHPFHIHGAVFQVLREDGQLPRPENRGWKDTVLVTGRTELLVRFNQPAATDTPFMFHCHILEHEDRGMMGQFTVT